MIIFLLTLILVSLVLLVIGGALLYSKLNTFLTWNTRYQSAEYEQAITTPKLFRKAPKAAASITRKNGKEIMDQGEMVDLADLDFETGIKAVTEFAGLEKETK